MSNRGSRKKWHNRSWGNWRYTAANDTLFWDKDKEWPYDIGDFDNADAALRWLAHMNTKKDHEEQDIKDCAEAFSEILRCPGLANTYDVHYHTLPESKDCGIQELKVVLLFVRIYVLFNHGNLT